jgi:hypothetical protein
MNTTARLAVFGGALVLLTAGAFAVGDAIGPVSAANTAQEGAMPDHAGMAAVDELPGGLASSKDGYTLAVADTTPEPGRFSFTITGPDGRPVTAYDVEHELPARPPGPGAGRHLERPAHPARRRFLPRLRRLRAHRREADDPRRRLLRPGDYRPATYATSRVANVDGYTVELAGDLTAGKTSPLTLTVRRDGVPVTDLQPYLGAYGHLVALRGGDLAYLHVHPEGEPGDGKTAAGPQVKFAAEVPSAGTYRLFLDFRHGDVVRTAEFTLPTAGTPAPEPAPAGHGH